MRNFVISVAALLCDQTGNVLVEYAMVAAGIALPLIAIGYAIASSAGSGLGHTTTGLSNLGMNPP